MVTSGMNPWEGAPRFYVKLGRKGDSGDRAGAYVEIKQEPQTRRREALHYNLPPGFTSKSRGSLGSTLTRALVFHGLYYYAPEL